jgi:hypothetical protein
MERAPDIFIWTKIGDDGGEVLLDTRKLRAGILQRKEAERAAGSFWWGVGSSLKRDKWQEALRRSEGQLLVMFSKQLSLPKKCKSGEEREMFLWTHWLDESGTPCDIPYHAMVLSGEKERYYALVCHSDEPLYLRDLLSGRLYLRNQPFNEGRFTNFRSEKGPCNSHNTVLLTGDLKGGCEGGRYRWGFRATLVNPFFVELDLKTRRKLEPSEKNAVVTWDGKDYAALVRQIRG